MVLKCLECVYGGMMAKDLGGYVTGKIELREDGTYVSSVIGSRSKLDGGLATVQRSIYARIEQTVEGWKVSRYGGVGESILHFTEAKEAFEHYCNILIEDFKGSLYILKPQQ